MVIAVVLTTALAASCLPASADPQVTHTQTVTISIPDKQRGGIDVSHPYGYHLKPILDRIKATPDQRKAISGIVDSYRGKIQPLRDQYKLKKQEFWEGMFNGQASEVLMSRQMEMGHLESDIVSKYCMMRLEIRRNLNAKQIILFEQYCRQQGWRSQPS